MFSISSTRINNRATDMSPRFASNNSCYCRWANLKCIGKFIVVKTTFKELSNSLGFGFGKFCINALCSHAMFSVPFTIGSICLMRIPSKIGKMIIGWISIIVATFHSFWTWADKSQKNKTMDSASMVFFIFKQGYSWSIPRTKIRFSYRWLFDFWFIIISVFRFPRPDIAKITDFVITKARNLFPYFFINFCHTIYYGTKQIKMQGVF